MFVRIVSSSGKIEEEDDPFVRAFASSQQSSATLPSKVNPGKEIMNVSISVRPVAILSCSSDSLIHAGSRESYMDDEGEERLLFKADVEGE